MSVKTVVALCLVASTFAVDFEDWKENEQAKMVGTRERKMYEGVSGSLDACLSEADSREGGMVQYHRTYNVCTIYASEITDGLVNTTDFALYTKSPEAGVDDEGMSTRGLIVTIILSIIFGLCLIFLALNCDEEHVSIAEQIEGLEKKENQIEEAVSEDWERKSQAEEAEEMKEIEANDAKKEAA